MRQLNGLICPGKKIRFQHMESWHKTSMLGILCSALCVNCSLTIIHLLSEWLTQVDGAASDQCKKVFTRKLVHDVGMENVNFNFLFTKY